MNTIKTTRMCLLAVWLILAGCVGSTGTAVVEAPVSPTLRVTPISPTVSPVGTLSPSTSPAPSPSPTPGAENHWVCYQGGAACYDALFDVSMLNSQEGWAVGYNNVVLHYTTHPGHTEPTWQQVYPFHTPATFNDAITAVGPNEWWGLHGASLVHYKEGAVQEFAVGLVQDLAIVGDDEVWAVGDAGSFHYRRGKIEEAWRISPEGQIFHFTSQDLLEIDMLNETEGWVLGTDSLFRYRDGAWEEVNPPRAYTPLHTVGWVNAREGWVSANMAFLHFMDGEWQIVSKPRALAFDAVLMLSKDEGWAVGPGILHYTRSQ